MGGRASRQKGIRSEYIVRDQLKETNLYDEVYRVPLSGASEGYKCDVVARINRDGFTHEVKFEVKSRYNEFKALYKIFELFSFENVLLLKTEHFYIKIFDLPELTWGQPPTTVIYSDAKLLLGKYYRSIRKLDGMYKLLGQADYLVIKNNNKKPLYIRYLVR